MRLAVGIAGKLTGARGGAVEAALNSAAVVPRNERPDPSRRLHAAAAQLVEHPHS